MRNARIVLFGGWESVGKETNYKGLCLVNEKENDKGIDSSFEIKVSVS